MSVKFGKQRVLLRERRGFVRQPRNLSRERRILRDQQHIIASAWPIFAVALLVISSGQQAALADPGTEQAGRVDDSDKPEQPSEVIVVVGRVDAPPETLTQSNGRYEFAPLSAATSLSVAESLSAIAGVHARNQTNFAQDARISIRGFGTRSAFGVRGIKVVLDGVPLTGPDGLAQIDIIDPDAVASLDVLRGSAGALFGNGSAGVLAFETAGPNSQRGVSTALRVGDFGFSKLSARASESFGTTEATVSVSRLKVAGYRSNSRTSQRIVNATGSWSPLGKLRLRLAGAFVDAPIGQDPGGLTTAQLRTAPMAAGSNNLRFATGESIRQGHLGSRADIVIDRSTRAAADGYVRTRSFAGSVPFRFVTVERKEAGGGGQIHRKTSVADRRLSLSLGAELSALVDERTNADNLEGAPLGPLTLDQNERVVGGGVFGRARLELSRWINLSVGLRLGATKFGLDDKKIDDGDDSDSKTMVLPSTFIGVSVVPTPTTTLFANVGDAFETPTVGEISSRPNEPGQTGATGFNRDLEAQTSRTFEVGARQSLSGLPAGLQRLEASVSAYSIFLNGELIRFEDDTGQSFFRNAGRSRRFGAELELDAKALSYLAVRLAITSIHAEFTSDQSNGSSQENTIDLSGNRVPGIAPHRVGAKISWSPPSGPFGSLVYDYTRATFANDENTERAPSQHLLGLRAGMRGRLGDSAVSYEGYLAILNATGTDHVDNLRTNATGDRFYEPGWPRHAVLGIKLGWDFAGSGPDQD